MSINTVYPTKIYRCFGVGCSTLILGNDELYHCNDCGLVYQRPDSYEDVQGISTVSCRCASLVGGIEWWLNECFGYDGRYTYYFCKVCDRKYKIPTFASIEKQKSEWARAIVQKYIDSVNKKHEEKFLRIRQDIILIMEALKEVSPEERQALLKPLLS